MSRLLCGVGALYSAVMAARAFTLPPAAALSPPLEFTAGLLWAAALALAALRGVGRVRWLLVGGFAVYHAVRLIGFAQADYDRGRFPLLLFMTGMIIIVTLFFAARSHRNERQRAD